MFNEATIIGRIGKKDVKQTKNGTQMCTLSVATVKTYKDSQGLNQKQTTWHYVNCFSKLGENIIKHCDVGDLILAKGEINLTKVGEQNYYAIHANEVKFIQKGQPKDKPAPQVKQQSMAWDDDIPF